MKLGLDTARPKGLVKGGLVACLLLVCAAGGALRAAGPGDEVIVVYNSVVPESKQVAEHYAERRQVPAGQVFGYPMTTNEIITRAEFRDTLQLPLAKTMEARKLWRIGSRTFPATTNRPSHTARWVVQSKIRYAVLCYGVPLRINADPTLKEEGTENWRPEMLRNEAAVDNDLALLPQIEARPRLAGSLLNPVYTTTNTALLHPTNGLLLVTRLDGPSAAIARGLVDKAIQAETEGFWGRAYFDLRNITEPGFKLGDDWIRGAAEVCKHLGFETVVDENAATFPAGFPMSQIAIYMGWYADSACGPFAAPTVEFMPGAFAYHLHSFSAASLRTTTTFWAGPFLAKGVTATMGTVWEPYLGGTPDMAVFASRWLYSGFTFGEAAYACQSRVSWQTTVIGDPLYRPMAKNFDQFQAEMERQGSKYLDWSYLRVVNANLVNHIRPVASLVEFLEPLEITKRSAVLTEKLGDLYEAQGKPSSAVHAYVQALERSPSPQQRLRLRLTLGEKLAALDHAQEASDQYQALLRENPDYPDKLAIYQKLLPLAQKLNQTAQAEKYGEEIKLLSPTNKP
ncbi:conserved exported hypothetical protein [Verrucomicrobia bacterium]|nr:conserved exported hypothetical protein [Verrucomicrobiota bacterium]